MSIRKRTWGDGKSAWVVDYRDAGGKRRNKTFARKKDADRFEAQAKTEVRAGLHTADAASVPVSVASSAWLQAGWNAGLEPTTSGQREQHVRLHILPFLGDVKISQLNVPRIRQFEADLRDAGRSPALVRKVLVSLSGILAEAQARGWVARNVVREAPTRRRPADRHRARLEVGVDIPSPEEVRAIVASSSGPYRALVLTALFTGLRVSELRGLDWRDVDPDRLVVRQRANLKGAIGSPKSAAGRRTVPFPPMVANALRERRLATGGVGLVFGVAPDVSDSTHCIVRNGWWPAQVAGLGAVKYPGIHACRHFFASWCINAREAGGLGLDLKTVQARLGHATAAMTIDTYGHLFPRRDDATALAEGEAALMTVPPLGRS